MEEHFGLPIRSSTKYGPRISRGSYALINKRSSTYSQPGEFGPEVWAELGTMYDDEAHRFLTDEFCQRHREAALRNFDRNMAYFAGLGHSDFQASLAAAVASDARFVQVDDLASWAVSGLYIMVLDDFSQAYVGVAGSIKDRIRQHWTTNKQFDRLLWGTEFESILSIDSFRALDTTRIYALKTRSGGRLEDKVMNRIGGAYLLNRIMGGGVSRLLPFGGPNTILKSRALPDLEPQ